jgi:Ycf66 protein N-terminus
VNFGIPAPLLFGIILAVASAGLLLTSKFKPELHEESDNIYAFIGFVCGMLLLTQLDLGIGMAFQQMLMIGSVVTLMWQYVQVRAENKRLKGGGSMGGRGSSGREQSSRRSGYAAKIDDEPEYAPPARNLSRRLNSDRQDDWNNNYGDDFDQSGRDNGRMLPEFRRTNQVDDFSRRQDEYSDYEAPAPRDYGRRSDSNNSERPPADKSRRSRRSSNDAPAAPAKNKQRRSSLEDSADEPAAKSSAYVDYEPIEPSPPASGEQPIQFPDQY